MGNLLQSGELAVSHFMPDFSRLRVAQIIDFVSARLWYRTGRGWSQRSVGINTKIL
jgi:hypothetical protein